MNKKVYKVFTTICCIKDVKMRNKKFIFILVVMGFLILSLCFVFATIAAPAVWAEGNTTSLYDEGVFTINWTAGAGDAAANYTLHLWMNDNFINSTDNVNISTLGYAWSNATEANYTFSFSALNASDAVTGANSSNVSMYVDATAPLVNWTDSGYNNVTYKKNTDYLTVNLSVGDALSGLTNSYCIFDINTTNESIAVSSNWCNSTYLNLTGLSDGNQTIDVWVNDTVNNVGVNLSHYVVWVDTTAPTVTLPQYSNATTKKNTDNLILNISVSDVASGLTNSLCVFDINGTNETVAVSSGWCNTTQLNLTGLADGNHTIDIWVNDTLNTVKLNNSYAVWIDTTNPTVPTFSCTPFSVYDNANVSCSCSGSTSSSTINTSYGSSGYSFTQYPSTSSRGTFTLTCTTKDYSGNTNSVTTTYTVARDQSTGGSLGGGVATWTNTYIVTDEQFKEGFTRELRAKNRVRVSVGGSTHHVGIKEVTETTAKISIESDPIEAILNVGDIRKFDVDSDAVYDIQVTLNSILGGVVDITILSIFEEVTTETEEVEQEKEESAQEIKEDELAIEKDKNLTWLWILIGVVIIVLGFLIFVKKKK
jgi:Bacterial Ig-like domain (group 3)